MSLLNAVDKNGKITQGEYKIFLLLLSLFAPHITEEIWERQGFGKRITDQAWPAWDEAKCVEATVEILVQVNGKGKARLNLPADIAQGEALALAREAAAEHLEGKAVVKELYVPGRLVNIVVK